MLDGLISAADSKEPSMVQPRARLTLAPLLWQAVLTGVLFAIPLVPSAVADSWEPFTNKRVVSPTGRRYVVIRERGHGCVHFELCERRESAPPMKKAVLPWAPPNRARDSSAIDRDPEDTLLASGTVDHLPVYIHVLEKGGFVLFETYYWLGHGNIVTYVDDHGKVVLRKTLDDIYGGVPKGSSHTVSSLYWERGHWIDQDRQSLVVISRGDEVREVGLASRAVTSPDVETLTGWCRGGLAEDRSLALEVASRMVRADETRPDGAGSELVRRRRSDILVPVAVKILGNAEEPLGLRVRAAILLVRAQHAKQPEAYGPMFLQAICKGSAAADRGYAAEHLPEILGIQALPSLRELMRGPADTAVWGQCQRAFASLGERSVPTLMEMLREGGTMPDYRGGAAHALGMIRSPTAIPALLEAAGTADAYTANAAINAAISTGAPDLADRLIALLLQGSTQDGRIATYFKDAPVARAIPALEQALGRASPDSSEARWLREAIEACQKK